MSNPYGRKGKAGYIASILSVPILGGVMCYFGQVGWGITLIISGIVLFVISIWMAYGRK